MEQGSEFIGFSLRSVVQVLQFGGSSLRFAVQELGFGA